MPIERIRGRKLQAIRERLLRANPLCTRCEAKGLLTAAVQVDHVQALTNDGTDTDDNRQGLCRECHKIKTAEDMGYKQRTPVGADGYPLGDHPWNMPRPGHPENPGEIDRKPAAQRYFAKSG